MSHPCLCPPRRRFLKAAQRRNPCPDVQCCHGLLLETVVAIPYSVITRRGKNIGKKFTLKEWCGNIW